MPTETDYSYGRSSGIKTEFSTWLQQTAGFAKRYARELFRNKAVLFWTMVFPAGFYLLGILLFLPDSLPADAVPDARAIMAISYGTFGGLIAALNGFSEPLSKDIDNDRYLQFRALSIAPSADVVGRFLAGTVLCLVAFLFVIPVAIATDAAFSFQSAVSPVIVVLALVTFAVFWMSVAVAIASVISEARYVSLVTVSLALVAFMLSGYNGTQPELYAGPDVLLNLMPHTLSSRLISTHLVASSGETVTPPALPSTASGLALLAVVAAASLVVALAITRRELYQRQVVPEVIR